MILPAITSAITPSESARLRELARDKVVLEVGAWYGYSTVLLAQVARIVHSVDWHRGDPNAGQRDTLAILWRHLEQYGVRDKVVLHVGSTEDVLPMLRPGVFDLAFHDGYHVTSAVARDAALIRPLLKPGALLAFHDYGRFGVRPAVDALHLPRVSVTGSLAVVQA